MKYLFWPLLALLIVLHQDYWQWDDATLRFGFLPQALAYHACLSIAAAVFWAWACRFCWPLDGEPAKGQLAKGGGRSEAASSATASSSTSEEAPS